MVDVRPSQIVVQHSQNISFIQYRDIIRHPIMAITTRGQVLIHPFGKIFLMDRSTLQKLEIRIIGPYLPLDSSLQRHTAALTVFGHANQINTQQLPSLAEDVAIPATSLKIITLPLYLCGVITIHLWSNEQYILYVIPFQTLWHDFIIELRSLHGKMKHIIILLIKKASVLCVQN